MVEGARLESVFRGNSNEGSNPSLSATYFNDLREKSVRCFALQSVAQPDRHIAPASESASRRSGPSTKSDTAAHPKTATWGIITVNERCLKVHSFISFFGYAS